MFDRGFKSWCERTAIQHRQELGVKAHEPLDAFALAKNLDVKVKTLHDLQGLSVETKKTLIDEDPDSWSALCISNGTRKLIVLNPTHSAGRQSSDLMHELSHHLCNHQPSPLEVTKEGLLFLHAYEKKLEVEADWLAGCLLLPREALIHIAKRKLDVADASTLYVVSQRMLKYRLDISGVSRQFNVRRAV